MVLTRSTRARVAASDIAQTPDAVVASPSTRTHAAIDETAPTPDDADSLLADQLQSKLELTDSERTETTRPPSSSGSSSSSKDAQDVEEILLNGIRDKFAEADLDVVEAVKELLEEASLAVKSVEEYKRKPEKRGWTATAVSLSRLTQAHMTKLGVAFRQPIPFAGFNEVMQALLSHEECDDIRDQFTNWNNGEFLGAMKLWKNHLGAQNEAASRILLNHIILAAIEICLKNDSFLLVIPEPLLARKGAYAVVECPASKTAMFLTGLAHYCLITLEGDQVTSKTVSHVVEKMKEKKTLDDKLDTTSKLDEDPSFVIIELKDRTKDLWAQLPQAVGEAIVVLCKTEGRPRQRIIPFCLTNITAWIFGVLDKLDGGYKCYTTEALTASVGFTREEQIKALVLWATVSGSLMRETIVRITDLE